MFGVHGLGATGVGALVQDSADDGATDSLTPRQMWSVAEGRGGAMAEEQTYDDGRTEILKAMLRALADRIQALDAEDAMLPHAGELMKLIGDVRSELFHYEVRCTYDTPEVAEHRRLVDEARRPDESAWEPTGWTPEDDEEIEW
jgi:hypothetical protein